MHIRNQKAKPGIWLSTFVSIAGLLLIVLIAYIFEKTVSPNLNKSLMTVISVFIAIIPPILWLTVFYRQDRLNPEPKSLVFKTLILGALVQKAAYAPTMSLVFPQGSKNVTALSGNLIVIILLTATIQEAFKLLSVRYSVYPSSEFDEDVDGIIYGSALGLGFAAMTSIDNIVSSGSAMLTNVTCMVVIESFAHASITGLSGYILGVSKQKKFNVLRLPFALILASALNAITQFLLNSVVRQGFKVNYIIGLIPAAFVAIIVFGTLVVISSRHEKAGGDEAYEPLERREAIAGILPVWVILILAVAVGLFVSNASLIYQNYLVDGAIEIQYPASWVQFKNDTDIFKAAEMVNGGEQEFVCVKKLPLSSLISVEGTTDEERLQYAAAAWSIKSGMNYRFYQPEDGYYLETKGKESYIINYVYVPKSQSSFSGSKKTYIGYGRDILAVYGSDLYIITISSCYENFVLNGNTLSSVDYSFNVN
jgi:RsiW-degrading membrane proteinase PrsW (M82 family)